MAGRKTIYLDNWKFDIFKKHLEGGGFEYEKKPGLVPETMGLAVITDDIIGLAYTVKAANDECAQIRAAKEGSRGATKH